MQVHVGIETMIAESGFTPAELARELEDRRFESLWLGEHTHVPVGSRQPSEYAQSWDTDRDPQPLPESYRRLPDPLVSLSFAAAHTSRLRLGFGVLLVLQHHPLTVAHTVATLDDLSDGRVLLGVGTGWNPLELANHNPVAWRRRYRAMAEFVAAMRTVWTQEEAAFAGEFYNFDPVWSNPKPRQRPGPPVIVPGTGPLGMQHAATWGDSWYPMDDRIVDLPAAITQFRKLVAEAGRDDVGITLGVRLRPDAQGSWPDADLLRRYRDLGVERAVLTDDQSCIPARDERLRMLDGYAHALDDLAQ